MRRRREPPGGLLSHEARRRGTAPSSRTGAPGDDRERLGGANVCYEAVVADSHLVGSVPLDTAEGVFRRLAAALGGQLERIPDGETGERANWIGFQLGRLLAADGIEHGGLHETAGYGPMPSVRLTRLAAEIRLGSLGYAEAARASYKTFARLREEGVIPSGVRFQVSLPTPLAVVNAWVALADQDAFEPVYEARLLEELVEILDAVPHEDLAIQWDVAVEIAILEGSFPATATQDFDGILRRLVRLAGHVPEDIQLGYHLCWGDYEHRHFKEPESLALAVEVANRIADESPRGIDWLHMPVPRDRADEAYFRPLADLRVAPATRLYLGVVHPDGVEATQRRLDAARAVLGDDRHLGVATECGMGRTPRAELDELLRVHAEVGRHP